MTSGHSVSLGNADDPAEYDPASPFESRRGHHFGVAAYNAKLLPDPLARPASARVSDRLQSHPLAPEPHRATHSEESGHMDRATVDQLLTTTRTVRKRLDLSRPVEPAVIQECL